MKLSNIWRNYSFWFKVSLVSVLFWFIFSLALSLVVYFSWPYDVHGFESIIFRFLLWFFILPALALLGIVNSVPFIVEWLFEDIPERQQMISRIVPTASAAPHVNNIHPQPQRKVQSYQDVSSRLMEEKEAHEREMHEKEEAAKLKGMLDFEDYDDF